jgi:hypothetical protein
MSVRLDSAYTFDAYVPDAVNRLAIGAAQRCADAPGTYNPLVIHGPTGSGKTHLLHAIGHRAQERRPSLRVVYEAAATFLDRLSRAVEDGHLDDFRRECLRIELLLLDDLQVLCGKVRTQIHLLPIWDRMGQNGAQVVLASDRPPVQIDALQARLEARFARLLVVSSGAPVASAQPARPQTASIPTWDEVEALPPLTGLAPAPPPAVQRPAVQRLAVQPLAGRVPEPQRAVEDDPFGSFLSDIAATVAEVVDAAPWEAGGGTGSDSQPGTQPEAEPEPASASPEPLPAEPVAARAVEAATAADGATLPPRRLLGGGNPAAPAAPAADPAASPLETGPDRWFLDREKLAWEWLALDDRLSEEFV